MAFVYILQSESTGTFYIGSTNDLQRRLSEHARSHSLATRGRGPWTLVHEEALSTLLLARQREREIKDWKSAKKIVELLAAKFTLRPSRRSKSARSIQLSYEPTANVILAHDVC